MEGRTDKADTVYGRASYRGSAGSKGRREDGGSGPQAWGVGGNALRLEGQYGGLKVFEAKRLRALEDDNGRLKGLLAGAMLDNAGLKDLLLRKW